MLVRKADFFIANYICVVLLKVRNSQMPQEINISLFKDSHGITPTPVIVLVEIIVFLVKLLKQQLNRNSNWVIRMLMFYLIEKAREVCH